MSDGKIVYNSGYYAIMAQGDTRTRGGRWFDVNTLTDSEAEQAGAHFNHAKSQYPNARMKLVYREITTTETTILETGNES